MTVWNNGVRECCVGDLMDKIEGEACMWERKGIDEREESSRRGKVEIRGAVKGKTK